MNETKRICWISSKKSIAFLYLIKENITIESGFIPIVIETIKILLKLYPNSQDFYKENYNFFTASHN